MSQFCPLVETSTEMAEESVDGTKLPAGSEMEVAEKSDPGDSEQEAEAEDEEEDVYEVEKILDYKVEEGEILYRVRWKGYTSEDDTWEPEAHLEDCKEVLLTFKKKAIESKSKPTKKEHQKLNLSDDIFEAESEGDWHPESEDEAPIKKKKKKPKDEDDTDGVKKKKSKSEKSKEKFRSDDEQSENLTESTSGKESKSKKRNLEFLEDSTSTKKQRKEERKESKKNKKEDSEEGKKKQKDASKESKKRKKDKQSEIHVESKQSTDDGSDLGTADQMDVQDEKTETKTEKASEETSAETDDTSKREPDDAANTDDEQLDTKEKKKKKKDKKLEVQEQMTSPSKTREDSSEKKNQKKESSHNKKQKNQEKPAVSGDSDKVTSVSTKIQKTSKVGTDESGHKSATSANEGVAAKKLKKNKETDSVTKPTKDVEPSVPKSERSTAVPGNKEKGLSRLASEEGKGKEKASAPASSGLFEKFSLDTEADKGGHKAEEHSSVESEKSAVDKTDDLKATPKVQDKAVKKIETAKEPPGKRRDSEKEDKGRKEQKIIESARDLKGIFDVFKKLPEEHNRTVQKNEKTVEDFPDFRYTSENKAKENKPVYKERRSTRDDGDSWLYGPSEGNHEFQDTVCQTEENTDGRQQVLNLGMDLQLEWMTLESFQKHIDGEDEILSTTENISNSQLREAVKNGDYLTVKLALNSKEEYNLDQEDSSGMTLVMLAAAGGQDDILRLLIKKGAKLNARQKTGTTALIHAAEKNFLTTVAVLLEAGALVNAQQISGETALMKACKRGNADIVRLMLEYGADCNILSKHQNSALHYAKQSNNVMLYDLLRNHMETLSRVAEDTIRDYFEARLSLLEPVFPIACHRLCEGPDFSMDFNYKLPHNTPEGSGILLFIFHANFFSGSEIVARLCGPCSVQAVILNDKFQLPVFLDSHFIYSFSPAPGPNKLFIRLTEAPTAKVKLLICAYRVQLN